MFTLKRFAALVLGAAGVCSAAGMRQETIVDPTLNMVAYNVNVPAGWKYEGTYVAGSSCSQIPFPVFRAYSPDGLSELRRLPRLDWTFSNTSNGGQHPDCLNLKQELTAEEFLKYLMGVMQVSYVRDSPIPQQMRDSQNKFLDQLNATAANNARMLRQPPTVQHADFAAAYAEYRNGTFSIEQHTFVKLLCIRAPLNQVAQPGSFGETCSATVRVMRAPKGKLDALIAELEVPNMGAHENPDWEQRYMQAMQARNNAILQQRREEFARAAAVRTQQHEQFLANMQAGTDRSMANARAIANSNHTIASDWCDYVLDRQTVSGPGGTVKVSNAYTHTWTNGAGQYYQTNSPNANPNGALSGNWTQTQQVHGDGSH